MRDTLTPCPKIFEVREGGGPNNFPVYSQLSNNNNAMKAKVSKEAKETIQECLTEFILFLTSEAWELCEQNERKTLLGTDLI